MTVSRHALEKVKDVKVEKILSVSADEISKLENLALELQAVLESLVGTAEGINSRGVRALQSLDYITQSLSALSNVMADAAPQASSDWVIDSQNGANAVLLRDLKNKFMEKTSQEADFIKPTLVSNGQCDYF